MMINLVQIIIKVKKGIKVMNNLFTLLIFFILFILLILFIYLIISLNLKKMKMIILENWIIYYGCIFCLV